MDTILLTKVIAAVAYPVGVISVLILFRLIFWYSKILSSLLSFFIVALFLVCTNLQVANYLVHDLEHQYPQLDINDIAKHDAIIVLGGSLRLPAAPSNHAQLSASSDRLWYAVRLYRAGTANKIILTGGNVFTQPGLRSEAHYASELLQDWGVPRASLTIESTSRNTRQNKDKLEHLLNDQQITSALLVTSALHMPRAYAIFSELPIKITPASADVLLRNTYTPSLIEWLPSSAALSLTTRALHEYYGIWFVKLSKMLD